MIGLAGAALFHGDGMVTPAISVLSAVEGLVVAAPVLKSYVVPITIVVLVGLFVVQSRGSERIGAYFGPIMAVWFAVLAVAELVQVVRDPAVLAALNPVRASSFLAGHAWIGFLALGSVFLALTGAEALYADMGHFGRGPIRLDWFALVLPALVLNYFGQGALVLAQPEAADSPFFKLFPDWGLWPIVLLATEATVIASQAVISGAFSLSQQAMQLGLLPRLDVRQTSAEAIGQVYVPQVNWLLMVCVLGLVLSFKSSDNLAGAYGIAVAGTMVITTSLLAVVARRLWRWSLPVTVAVIGFFLVVDAAFFAANAVKIPRGGWFPLLIGAIAFMLMSTWRRGRQIILERTSEDNPPLQQFIAQLDPTQLPRVKGTAVYLAARQETAAYALLDNLRPFKKIVRAFGAADKDEKDCERVEFLCAGQLVVVHGIHPDTKRPYEWPHGGPGDIRWEDLPPITAAQAEQLRRTSPASWSNASAINSGRSRRREATAPKAVSTIRPIGWPTTLITMRSPRWR
jgi:KUP system potassium uptake protein